MCVTLNPPAHPPDELVTGITPKAGVDRLAVAKKQKSDTCVEETHTVNAEKSSPLAPPDSESQA
jgi:hypothetical protein